MCECESVPSHITVVDKSAVRCSELFITLALSSLPSLVLVPRLIVVVLVFFSFFFFFLQFLYASSKWLCFLDAFAKLRS